MRECNAQLNVVDASAAFCIMSTQPQDDYSTSSAETLMPYRNLIFCFDGTWTSATDRKLGTYYSNVFKIAENIRPIAKSTGKNRHHQLRFYYPGIGTRAFGYEIQGGAFGKGYERALESAYITLCLNYWQGDNVYIFGYSRGAIIAQALCRLISAVGILNPTSLDQYAKVWKVATEDNSGVDITRLRQHLIYDGRAGEEPLVNFLGLFDPVFAGSTLFVSQNFMRLCDPDAPLPKCVLSCMLCLAIDESRKRFLPFLWKRGSRQRLTQLWLPGVHGDIGGVNDNSIFGRVALVEIIQDALLCGSLKFGDEFVKKLEIEVQSFVSSKIIVNVNSEMNAFWRIMGARRRTKLYQENSSFHRIIRDLVTNDSDVSYKGRKGKFSSYYRRYMNDTNIRWN